MMSAFLGTFLLWKKSVFLTDSIVHSAIFGIFISNYFEIYSLLGMIIFSCIFAFLLVIFEKFQGSSKNLNIAVISNFLLISGIFLMYLNNNYDHSFEHVFLGNIKSININDIYLIAALDTLVLILFVVFRKKILLFLIDKDLFLIEKVDLYFFSFLFYFLIIIGTFISLKIFGSFVVIVFFLIPSIAGSFFAKNISQNILFAFIFSCLSVLITIFIKNYIHINVPLNIFVSFVQFVIFFIVSFLKFILP